MCLVTYGSGERSKGDEKMRRRASEAKTVRTVFDVAHHGRALVMGIALSISQHLSFYFILIRLCCNFFLFCMTGVN